MSRHRVKVSPENRQHVDIWSSGHAPADIFVRGHLSFVPNITGSLKYETECCFRVLLSIHKADRHVPLGLAGRCLCKNTGYTNTRTFVHLNPIYT